MTNEKDSNVIHNLFAEFYYADDLGVIKSKLSEYVASVRKQEREAALKEAVETLNSIEYSRDADNGGYFYSGFLAAKKQLIGALKGKR